MVEDISSQLLKYEKLEQEIFKKIKKATVDYIDFLGNEYKKSMNDLRDSFFSDTMSSIKKTRKETKKSNDSSLKAIKETKKSNDSSLKAMKESKNISDKSLKLSKEAEKTLRNSLIDEKEIVKINNYLSKEEAKRNKNNKKAVSELNDEINKNKKKNLETSKVLKDNSASILTTGKEAKKIVEDLNTELGNDKKERKESKKIIKDINKSIKGTFTTSKNLIKDLNKSVKDVDADVNDMFDNVSDNLQDTGDELEDVFKNDRLDDLEKISKKQDKTQKKIEDDMDDIDDKKDDFFDSFEERIGTISDVVSALNLTSISDSLKDSVDESSKSAIQFYRDIGSIYNFSSDELSTFKSVYSDMVKSTVNETGGSVSRSDIQDAVDTVVNDYGVRNWETALSLAQEISKGVEANGTDKSDYERIATQIDASGWSSDLIKALNDNTTTIEANGWEINGSDLIKATDTYANLISSQANGDQDKAQELYTEAQKSATLFSDAYLDPEKMNEIMVNAVNTGDASQLSLLGVDANSVMQSMRSGDYSTASATFLEGFNKRIQESENNADLKKQIIDSGVISEDEYGRIAEKNFNSGDFYQQKKTLDEQLSDTSGATLENLTGNSKKSATDRALDTAGASGLGMWATDAMDTISEIPGLNYVASGALGFLGAKAPSILKSIFASSGASETVAGASETLAGASSAGASSAGTAAAEVAGTASSSTVLGTIGSNIGNTLFSIGGNLAEAGGATLGTGATATTAGTTALGAGAVAGGVLGVAGLISGGVDIWKSLFGKNDDGSDLSGKDKQDLGWSGGTKWGIVGAGAATGAAIGSVIPGAGNLAGALIGAGVGGVGALTSGTTVGKYFSDKWDEYNQKKEEDKANGVTSPFENMVNDISDFTSNIGTNVSNWFNDNWFSKKTEASGMAGSLTTENTGNDTTDNNKIAGLNTIGGGVDVSGIVGDTSGNGIASQIETFFSDILGNAKEGIFGWFGQTGLGKLLGFSDDKDTTDESTSLTSIFSTSLTNAFGKSNVKTGLSSLFSTGITGTTSSGTTSSTSSNVFSTSNTGELASPKSWLSGAIDSVSSTVSNIVSGITNLFDGSHKNGLSRVPFDGYKAILHKDEAVLTADQAYDYRVQKNTETSLGWIKEGLSQALTQAKQNLLTASTTTSSSDGGDQVDNPDGSGVDRWHDTVSQALSLNGVNPTEDVIQRVLTQMNWESGGDNNALQGITDTNSGQAFPSDINNGICPWCGTIGKDCHNQNIAHGLMQTIPSTFWSHKKDGHENIYNGYDNLLASIDYMKGAYNFPSDDYIGIDGPHGYQYGGISTEKQLAWLSEDNKNEVIVPDSTTDRSKSLAAEAVSMTYGKDSVISTNPAPISPINSLDETNSILKNGFETVIYTIKSVCSSSQSDNTVVQKPRVSTLSKYMTTGVNDV